MNFKQQKYLILTNSVCKNYFYWILSDEKNFNHIDSNMKSFNFILFKWDNYNLISWGAVYNAYY